MSSLPTSNFEMYRGANSNGEPLLVIRQPTTIEAAAPGQGPRPSGMWSWMTDSARGHLTAMIGEFLGTMMFLFFGYLAAQTANEKIDITLRTTPGALGPPSGPSLIQISYISAVFGLSLAVNVFVWYRVSGGQFNPSISIGLWLAGAFNWVRLICVIPAQLLGAIAAAAIVSAVVPGKLQAENSLGAGVSITSGLIMEAILTSMLMMTILMLAVEKSRVSFMAPLLIGTAVLIIHLVGINVSGASVNPARTLGPAVVNNSFVPEFWIYFAGPTLGAVAAAIVHALLKSLAYQTANAGQDGDGMEYYRLLEPQGIPVNNSYKNKTPSYASPTMPGAVRYPSSGSRGDWKVMDDERVLLEDLSPVRSRKSYPDAQYIVAGSDRSF